MNDHITVSQIAVQVMPHFSDSVVREHRPRTYGSLCHAIGLDPIRYGQPMGRAMHAIGAACVLQKIPIAPLYWVKRTDDANREVFASRRIEIELVLPDRDFLSWIARDYRYTPEEMSAITNRLRKAVDRTYAPEKLWERILLRRPDKEAKTYYELAKDRYKQIEVELRRRA